MTAARGEAVVLLHGLWLSGWAMGLIARRLRACGFRMYTFSYPSMGRTLRENAQALRRFSDEVPGEVVHFVGHSLGGVVIQTMLAHCPPPRPGRVVTLSSPHAGSRAARALSQRSWGRRLLGASMADLLRGADPPANPGEREVGLIKGELPHGLARIFVDFQGPNDGVVALDEMRWSGAKDEIVLHVSHSGLLWSRETAQRICEFLQTGRFARS